MTHSFEAVDGEGIVTSAGHLLERRLIAKTENESKCDLPPSGHVI